MFMQMPGPSIVVVQTVAHKLRSLRPEVDFPVLFSEFDLPNVFQASPETRIEAECEARFVQRACQLADDIDLGFEIGLTLSQPANLPAYIARYSPTVREGIATALQFVGTVRPGMDYTLDENGNHARLSLSFASPFLFECPRFVELVFAAITAQIRAFTGRAFYPDGLCFTHTRGPVNAKVRARIGCGIEFSGPACEMLIGFAMLDAPIVSHDEILRGFLMAEGKRSLEASAPRPLPAHEAVELLIEKSMPGGVTSLETVASQMGMSPRSLSRRLQEAQTSFSQILNHVRLRAAVRALSEGREPIGEIAYRLGYNGQSAFATAFRRETGQSPSAFRKAQSVRA